jgi:hypothetical protein
MTGGTKNCKQHNSIAQIFPLFTLPLSDLFGTAIASPTGMFIDNQKL